MELLTPEAVVNQSPRRLPVELTDIIIDHLHDDEASLFVCALVEHDWLWSARYHLFHTTLITTSGDEKHGLASFLRVVASSPFALGNHVRCLHIRGAHDKTQDDFTSLFAFLDAVLPKLPSLRRITLSRMVWGKFESAVLPMERREPMPWELKMLSLKDIRLDASDVESLDNAQKHLSHLLQQFSSIRLLSIDTVRIGYRALYAAQLEPLTTDGETPRDGRRKCHISAINCFTEDDSFYLLSALSRLGFVHHLHTLKFGSGCPEITASAQVVANLAAPSLRFVRYRVPSDDYVASKIPCLDLSQCTALHTAHLRGFVSSATEARTVLTQMINTVTCTPPDAAAVLLEFFARPQDFCNLFEPSLTQDRWSLLDTQLSSRSSLRKVVLVLRSTKSPAELAASEGMLPLLQKQGKLSGVFAGIFESIQWHRLTGIY
ncbi:hypothetical protein EUX98_g5344 [Antrodiella citrinella]|uniref:F-box domain-containing protein n=1 Tax=Antrodiella citrinella TaxID=2447956 RepID=A0A4S4MTP4_9APHY|nr:hypothetical protein EUX98_g5344 [Antrodiella citrinella]